MDKARKERLTTACRKFYESLKATNGDLVDMPSDFNEQIAFLGKAFGK